jgi:putative transposase
MNKPTTEYWLTAEEAASYLNITVRVVHKNADAGKYGEKKYENGRRLIPLSGLPTEIQVAYLRDMGIVQTAAVIDDGWDQEPEWKRRIASERLNILVAWDKFLAARPDRNQVDLNEEFVRTWTVINQDNKFSIQTLYRWRKDYRTGGRMALLPGWGDGRRNDRSIDPPAREFFLKIYGTRQKRTIADCYEDLVTVAKEKNWRVPSLRTLQRIIQNDIPESTLIYLREGEEAFRNKCEPYIIRDHESVKGNQVWVGDHYRMDMFVKGPNGKPVRAWITGWLDFRSTKLVGHNMNYNPSTDTIMAAFSKPALDKTIGLPNDIYIDNGRDYSSYEFAGRGNRRQAEQVDEARVRSLVTQLGIVPHFAIPKNARAKTIERFFRIVAEKFCKRFPTYCGSDNKERPEGLEELLKNHPEKIPSFEEVQTAFNDWVKYVYNKLPSEGAGRQGECPDETFQRTRGPIRLAGEETMRLCMMRHSQPVAVQREGVKLLGQWYFDGELTAVHLGEKVYLRYRDEDMTKVFVFSMKDEFICEAAIRKALPVFGANKEDIRQAHHESKQVKRIAAEHARVSAEIEEEPDDLMRVLSRKKAAASPEPEPPNVIMPVHISREFRQSAFEIDRLLNAVGGERYQTPEQQRINKLERDRETMALIKKGLSK